MYCQLNNQFTPLFLFCRLTHCLLPGLSPLVPRYRHTVPDMVQEVKLHIQLKIPRFFIFVRIDIIFGLEFINVFD